jgi:hypothetical protein
MGVSKTSGRRQYWPLSMGAWQIDERRVDARRIAMVFQI